MPVQFLGYSSFTAAKTGKACLIICICYSDPRFIGYKCEQKFVSADLLDKVQDLKPGSKVNVCVNLQGSIVDIA